MNQCGCSWLMAGEPSGAVGLAIEQSVRRERLIVRRQNIACGRVTVLDKLDGIADSVADVADNFLRSSGGRERPTRRAWLCAVVGFAHDVPDII